MTERGGLDKKIETAWLAAFYGPLLTEKQRQALGLYCEEDLSLGEIGEQLGVSRQGVYDVIARAEGQLRELESKLGMGRRYRTVREGLEKGLALLGAGEAEAARATLAALLQACEEEDNGL